MVKLLSDGMVIVRRAATTATRRPSGPAHHAGGFSDKMAVRV
jgi:hypothetical protein